MPENGLLKLGQLFDQKRLHEINDGCLFVKETDKSATLKKLNIAGVGADAVAVWFDKAGHSTPFANGESVRRACDVILFCKFNGNGYVLILELKSGEPSKENYEAQLISAHCFTDYIISILKHFHDIDCRNWKRRYFVFHDAQKTSMDKRTTTRRRINDTPTAPWIFPVDNGQSIYLRKLLDCPL